VRFISSILFALLFSGTLAVAEYPKPPIEAYGALPTISHAEISPDGNKIAAIVNFNGLTRALFMDLNGGPPQQIGVERSAARGIEFYDNDHAILRASDTLSAFGFRGEFEYDGAFAINLKSLDVQQMLIGTKGMYPAQSGLGQIVGRAAKPGHVLMPAFMGSRGSDPSLDLLITKLGSKHGRRYMRGTPDTVDWFVGEGGEVLARERYNNRNDKYVVQWRDGNRWQDIFEKKTAIPDMGIIGVSVDETGLIFTRTFGEGDVLMRLGSDGEITGPIIPYSDQEISWIYTDNNRKVLGVSYSGVVPDYAFLDDRLQDSYDKISARLTNATIFLDSWSDDRSKVLYRVFEPAIGNAWIVHDRLADSLSSVGQVREEIPPTSVGYMMDITFKARDGLAIQTILTLPPDYDPESTPPLPTIMMPHGGPASYDRFDFDWMAQYFANRGYAVIQPNFRGSTGFGEEFQDAGRGEWGGKMQDDLSDGIKALVTAGIVDPDQVCIAGASYGGYAALAGAVFTPELYKCVVAIAPVSDLNLMMSTEKRDHGRDHWVVSYWEDVMAEGDARRAKLRAISPANFAENVTAPILLLHGNDDTVVPIRQSTKMRSALKRAKKDVELVVLKGEDHWLSGAETRLQTLKEMDRFLAEHLPVAQD